MIAGRPSEILRHLEERKASDRELLARFVQERDETAFAELVRTHGPIVLGACRRVTGHPQDAEDAFQAVFLILARKATTIRNPDVLGSWLYRVAVDVARKARRSAIRRRVREVAVSAMPDTPTPVVERIPELSPILDEELAALPSWYRDAIVLCDLRGVSREHAAAALSVPEGTLSSRLANGRKKLAARLAKRGITLSVAAIQATLSTTQAAVVSAELLTKTCSLVTDWMADGAIPKPLAKLTKGGMTVRKMFMLGLLTTAAAVAGVVYAAQPALNHPKADPPKAPLVAAKSEVGEQAAPDAKQEVKDVNFTSTPKLLRGFDLNFIEISTVRWNAQGTLLAIAGKVPDRRVRVQGAVDPGKTEVQVISFDSRKSSFISPENGSHLVGFAQDGKTILTEFREYHLLSGNHKLDFWEANKERPGFITNHNKILSLSIASTETVGYAFSDDGKSFRTLAITRNAATGEANKVQVVEVDATTGKRLKMLMSVDCGIFALSLDGKRLATIESDNTVFVYDVDRTTKISSHTFKDVAFQPGWENSRQIEEIGVLFATSLMFSQDGHRLFVCKSASRDLLEDGPWRSFTDLSLDVVLNADNGQLLPPIMDKDILKTSPQARSLTSDGRYLALSGRRYFFDKEAVKEKRPGSTQKEAKGSKQPNPTREQPPSAPSARVTSKPYAPFLTIWDTETGKVLTTWDRQVSVLAFNPVRPILVVLEPNGDDYRLGLWDFSREEAEKK